MNILNSIYNDNDKILWGCRGKNLTRSLNVSLILTLNPSLSAKLPLNLPVPLHIVDLYKKHMCEFVCSFQVHRLVFYSKKESATFGFCCYYTAEFGRTLPLEKLKIEPGAAFVAIHATRYGSPLHWSDAWKPTFLINYLATSMVSADYLEIVQMQHKTVTVITLQ